jgi:serine/threonine protein kinase
LRPASKVSALTTRAVPFGKYHLLERVNVGGMAEVYKAKMVGVEGFEKLLAIKRILPAIAADKDFIKMFIDEAKITVQLAHANIAQTFELGRLNETYYIAMEFVPGRDLRAMFERMRRRGETVPHDLACYVMSKVAEGLDYAHRKRDAAGRELGIIHRDVSPQNVLVSYEGEVKLIDFGIAKAANKMMKTQAGILKGKFGYMSPEQVRGVPLDRRSDIFAVGIVLHELLVGERLFVGESDYSVLEKVRSASVPRPTTKRRNIPPILEKIVLRALAKNPDDRYQHAGELVADLQRFLLSQERLFTREDLAAFMKASFAEEWEAEKRAALESMPLADERTPTSAGIPLDSETTGLSKVDRPRVEGAAARPSSPPPTPVPPSRRPSGLRSSSRLASAALSAETDKIELGGQPLSDDNEVTATQTEPIGRFGLETPDDRETPLAGGGAGVPFPLPGAGESLADIPTRVGKPAPRRQLDDDLTPIGGLPALAPPVEPGDEPSVSVSDPEHTEEDERTASTESARASRHPGAIAVSDDDDPEGTAVAPLAAASAAPRTNQWAIVPVAAVLALIVGGLTIRAVQHRWPFDRGDRIEEDLAAQAFKDTVREAPKGGLEVVTDPSDALILVDDKPVARSGANEPYVTDHLEADVEHQVVAQKEGFAEASTSVTVKEGQQTRVQLKLKPLNPVLAVRTTPSGARLYLDGEDHGKTPAKLATLEAGAHAMRLELKCYRTYEKKVLLARDVSLDVNLEPLPGACLAPRPVKTSADPGTLRLVASPPARVWIDGRDTGLTTPLTPGVSLAPGLHVVKLVAGGATREFEVEIEPRKTVTKIERVR